MCMCIRICLKFSEPLIHRRDLSIMYKNVCLLYSSVSILWYASLSIHTCLSVFGVKEITSLSIANHHILTPS